jgi:hypothetical protein
MLVALHNTFKNAARSADPTSRNRNAVRSSRWAKRRLQTLRDRVEHFTE